MSFKHIVQERRVNDNVVGVQEFRQPIQSLSRVVGELPTTIRNTYEQQFMEPISIHQDKKHLDDQELQDEEEIEEQNDYIISTKPAKSNKEETEQIEEAEEENTQPKHQFKLFRDQVLQNGHKAIHNKQNASSDLYDRTIKNNRFKETQLPIRDRRATHVVPKKNLLSNDQVDKSIMNNYKNEFALQRPEETFQPRNNFINKRTPNSQQLFTNEDDHRNFGFDSDYFGDGKKPLLKTNIVPLEHDSDPAKLHKHDIEDYKKPEYDEMQNQQNFRFNSTHQSIRDTIRNNQHEGFRATRINPSILNNAELINPTVREPIRYPPVKHQESYNIESNEKHREDVTKEHLFSTKHLRNNNFLPRPVIDNSDKLVDMEETKRYQGENILSRNIKEPQYYNYENVPREKVLVHKDVQTLDVSEKKNLKLKNYRKSIFDIVNKDEQFFGKAPDRFDLNADMVTPAPKDNILIKEREQNFMGEYERNPDERYEAANLEEMSFEDILKQRPKLQNTMKDDFYMDKEQDDYIKQNTKKSVFEEIVAQKQLERNMQFGNLTKPSESDQLSILHKRKQRNDDYDTRIKESKVYEPDMNNMNLTMMGTPLTKYVEPKQRPMVSDENVFNTKVNDPELGMSDALRLEVDSRLQKDLFDQRPISGKLSGMDLENVKVESELSKPENKKKKKQKKRGKDLGITNVDPDHKEIDINLNSAKYEKVLKNEKKRKVHDDFTFTEMATPFHHNKPDLHFRGRSEKPKKLNHIHIKDTDFLKEQKPQKLVYETKKPVKFRKSKKNTNKTKNPTKLSERNTKEQYENIQNFANTDPDSFMGTPFHKA